MASATNYEICATLQALQSYLYSIVGQYLKKLALLQRLASIIEQAGSLLEIPNISNLLPLSLIDGNNYNQIRCACPFLNLPPLSADESEVQDLVAMVAKGYQALDQYLASHPYSQMAALQDQLDSILAMIEQEALSAISPGLDVLGCLNAICQAANQLEIYSATFASTATSEFNSLSSSSSYTSVLSPTQQSSANLISSTRATLADLGNFTPPTPPPALSTTFS